MHDLVAAATILGTLISIATFSFVLAEWIKRLRSVADFSWIAYTWGTDQYSDGRTTQRVSITNLGKGTALLSAIVFAHATVYTDGTELVPSWVLQQGTVLNFELENYDPAQTWILIYWISAENRGKLFSEWLSTSDQSPLVTADRASAEMQRTRIRKQLQAEHNKPLGPGKWKLSYSLTRDLGTAGYTAALQQTQIPLPSDTISPSGIERYRQTEKQHDPAPEQSPQSDQR
ncbi:hypothetical protein [Bifidobacterium xylocopae]|uniref:hypothetical protein n=1 Tax=Bifidobacterium xylocopae TaxID=2493119 RepID=UPI000FDD91F7|nr:hypothetical protein [Bifidobacterium xylocopae]